MDASGSKACAFCESEFEPVNGRQRYCSPRCGWRHRAALRPKSEDWANGRQPERDIPCRDCGALVRTRGTNVLCPACKVEATRSTNRRKNVKRRGAQVGIRYTLTELGDRDGWRCHLCRKPVDRTLPGTDQRGPTVDHLIPLVDGGTDELANVALAHRACNVKRRDGGIAQLRLTG